MKPSFVLLIVSNLLCLLLLFSLTQNKVNLKSPYYEELLKVSERTKEAFYAIKVRKEVLGLDTSAHFSGMLGPDYTGITTTLGSYEAKATAADPHFGAVIYSYFLKMGLKKGDTVALHFSGSFPSLNIASIIAAEEYGLKPVIISSIGASTYGATDPQFSYPQMEYYLFSKGYIHYRSSLVSPGGNNDTGSDMDKKLLDNAKEVFKFEGVPFIQIMDYAGNLETRLSVFENARALVNVGGNYMSLYARDLGGERLHGLIQSNILYNVKKQGVIGAFLSTGKNVVNLLSIRDIALEFQMPLSPSSPVSPEDCGVYYTSRPAHIMVVFLLLSIYFLTLAGYYKLEKRWEYEKVKTLIREKCLD